MKNIVKQYLCLALCFLIAAHFASANGMNAGEVVGKAQTQSENEETSDKINLADRQSTASVYTISGDELLSTRSTNFIGALQGRLPGLRILQASGAPGQESYSISLRGYNSPTAAPVLFLVDGVERDITYLDVNDVESVTVMRDAAATAMYGMRGSGGVIMIKTKKGYVGTSTIRVSFDQAIQSPTRLPSFVSAYDYANMFNQRQANDTLFADMQDIRLGGDGIDHRGVPFYTPFELDRYRLGDNPEFFPDRDILSDFMKDFSYISRMNMNFQGGTSSMQYFTSVGFQLQDGLFAHQPFEMYSYDSESRAARFNFRSNLDISLNPTLKMWINVGGSMSRINAPFIGGGMGWGDAIAKMYETPSNAHNDLTPDSEVIVRRDRINFRNTQSIYGLLYRTGSQDQTVTKLGTNFGGRQRLDQIIPGLSASAQLAFDVLSRSTLNRSRTYQAFEVARFSNIGGQDSLGFAQVPGTTNSALSDGQGRFFSYMYDMNASLDYQQVFAQRHNFVASLLAERNILQMEDFLPRNFLGLAGRVAYNFDQRYMAEVNFAYQGSEQFAPGNRFGLFPSLSLGWVLSNEDFLADNSAINFLKLRTSYGRTGNSGYTYGSGMEYLFISRWNANATENQIGNEDLTFEKVNMFNIGFETEVFNSFYVIADYFHHRSVDVFVRDIATVPIGMIGTGAAFLPPANVGEVENKGFEFVAGYNKRVNNDLSFNLNGNLSFSQNEYIYMAELAYDETYAYPFRLQGYSINHYWGYVSDGLFNNQQEIDGWADQSPLGGHPIPGDIRYVDLNNDGVIDERDRAPLNIGHQPEIVYGFRAQAQYKLFDISAFITGAARRTVYLNNFGRWSNRDNFTEYMKNAWTPEKVASGDEILYPRLGTQSTNNLLSDYWLVNGSFLRLRNLELGFTLPSSISNRINVGAIRLHANGFNLLVWDNLPNQDFDPETAASQNTNYPLTKSFIFGASVKF